MRTTILLLSLATFATAEAPYHFPRPSVNLPSINYQNQIPHSNPQFQPGPAPAPLPSYQYPTVQHQISQPNIQGHGYHYQQPYIAPTIVQQHSQPIAPATQPQFQINHQQPILQQPSLVYGSPQLRHTPQTQQPFPAQQPAYSAPQFIPGQQSLGTSYQQNYSSQRGPSYSAPQSTGQSAIAYTSQNSPSYSSYQADSNAYTGNQGHREPLDSTVVDRLQNILTQNEHSTAKIAGYQSLVSGVSLESARPSVEISSFIHNSPLQLRRQNQVSAPSFQDLPRDSGARTSQSSSGSVSQGAARLLSSSYGLPKNSINSAQNQGQIDFNFLPNTHASGPY